MCAEATTAAGVRGVEGGASTQEEGGAAAGGGCWAAATAWAEAIALGGGEPEEEASMRRGLLAVVSGAAQGEGIEQASTDTHRARCFVRAAACQAVLPALAGQSQQHGIGAPGRTTAARSKGTAWHSSLLPPISS